MLKKILIYFLILIGLTIFICTLVAIKRDEFNTSTDSSFSEQNPTIFVPKKFEAKTNDTQAIAKEAQSGDMGRLVVKDTKVVHHSNIFYKLYRFFAFIGYLILSPVVFVYRGY